MDTLNSDSNLLSQCKEIPVQSPGFVQSIGALVVFESVSGKITSLSENLSEFVESASSDWLGHSIKDCMAILFEQYEQLKKQLPEQRIFQISKNDLDLRYIEQNNSIIIEITRINNNRDSLEKDIGTEFYRLTKARSEKELHEHVLLGMQKIIKYDHLMIYKFDAQWNGEVIAEWINHDTKDQYTPYLSLCFPEQDVPEQARAMYLNHWVRYTADVNTPSNDLKTINERPENLSAAYLRGVAPSHVKYIQNMGVSATYSASIIVNGKLWGLIAAHHKEANPLSFEILSATEEFAKLYSSILSKILNDKKLKWMNQHRSLLAEFSSSSSQGKDPLKMSESQLESLAISFQASSVVIWDKNELMRWGDAPGEAFFRKALKSVQEESSDKNVYYTNHINDLSEEISSSGFAGILLIGAPFTAERCIFVLRQEEPQEKNWGGDPSKEAMTINNGVLNPRNSFDLWKSLLTGYSRPWTDGEVALAEAVSDKLTLAYITLGTLENAQKSAKLNMLNMLLHDIGNALSGVSGEILQLQQINSERSSLDNLERLTGFIKENYDSISTAIGDKKSAALYDLVKQIHERLSLKHGAIDDSIHHMDVGLTHGRELLDLQKVYAQSSTNYGRECRLVEIVNDAGNVLRSSIESRGKFTTHIQEDIPALTVDRSKIMQVVINIIKNGFEAWDARYENLEEIKKEALNIVVSIYIDNEAVVLDIRDNGVGLDRDQIEKLFDQAYSTKQRSSGIGLINCKNLANATGAELTIKSEGRGKGASAVLVFPKELWV